MRLEDYDISPTHGFLTSEPPLAKLPKYYEPWEVICENLYTLPIEGHLASKVADLPLLNIKELVHEPEWRRAYVLLGFIAHAYIWGSQKPPKVLPANVAVPLIAIAEHLDLPPVATYCAQNLWNYTPLDPDRSIEDPENFRALTTFTDSIDESWFFAIPAAIEARGAPIIPLTLQAFELASSDRAEEVAVCLQEISDHINALIALLPRMYERCRPEFFYNEIRPFLAGTVSTELPKGVFYEEENGNGDYRIHQGPTAAQSSLFHFLDIALGIRDERSDTLRDGEGLEHRAVRKEDEFLKKMRQHMPRPHRRFLEDITKTANIRPYIISRPHDVALQTAYNTCLDRLVLYRNKHLQIISRYILIPSRRAAAAAAASAAGGVRLVDAETEPGTAGRVVSVDDSGSRAANSSNDDFEKEKEKKKTKKERALGTGGTAPVEFLKLVRDETKECVLPLPPSGAR